MAQWDPVSLEHWNTGSIPGPAPWVKDQAGTPYAAGWPKKKKINKIHWELYLVTDYGA